MDLYQAMNTFIFIVEMVGSFQENASVPREQTPPEIFFFSIVTAKFPEYLPWENIYSCHLLEISFSFLLILNGIYVLIILIANMALCWYQIKSRIFSVLYHQTK